MPAPDEIQPEAPADLTPAIEHYGRLIEEGRYDEAAEVFEDQLEDATLYRPDARSQGGELLERLFPDGLDALPRLREPTRQSYALHSLAVGYLWSGRPGAAAPLFRATAELDRRQGDAKGDCDGLCNRSLASRLAGGLRVAESSARAALILARERGDRFRQAVSLQWIGLTLAVRGAADAEAALRQALDLWTSQSEPLGECLLQAFLAQRALWMDDPVGARASAERAVQLATTAGAEVDASRAARLLGIVAMLEGDLTDAGKHLDDALRLARTCYRVEEELPTRVALAELIRRRGEPERAREYLDEVWGAAERGPYPTFHADARVVLARLERDAGNTAEAITAATRAFELAWCDGPPFVYHRGLERAKALLDELGVPEPELKRL